MWRQRADKAIAGQTLSLAEGLDLLGSPDEESLPILDAAWRIRRHYFGNQVKANVLSNAKKAVCTEDCHYCSQSWHAEQAPAFHPLISVEELLAQAYQAKASGGRRFCITMAVRSPNWSAVDTLAEAARRIKAELGLEICACLGLMQGSEGQKKLARLRAAGVDAYNHNLNTHPDIYPDICGTHGYGDRLETLRNAREAGFSTCSGLIVGLGETDQQLVELAQTFRQEAVESIPVNFLIPIEGTETFKRNGLTALSPWKCLRILCLFRFMHPQAEIRVSAGRELHLRSMQCLALLPANSLFIDGYLTQGGQGAEKDVAMITDLGMAVMEYSFASGG